ncbi:MAG: c-type cytochrome [Chloroflexi bacterium]|nr:c-type cytochrome [Chloroflexota bacterium]
MRSIFKWLIPGCLTLLLVIGLSTIFSQPLTVFSAQTNNLPDAATVDAFARGGCATCHVIPGIPNAFGLVGPDLSTMGVEAADRKSELDAEAYIREAILDPEAYIATQCPTSDCPAGVMPTNMPEKLSEAELGRMVTYLLSLDGTAEPLSSDYEFVPIEIVRPPETSQTIFAEAPKTYADGEVLLGKYMFFDIRLSGDASNSCASCHQPERGWTDGQALSDGATGTMYFRNTPTVMNTVYQDYLYWDGRMDGADMPTLVRDHITEAHFMQMDGRLMVERIKQIPEYVHLFEEVYGSGPSFGSIIKAITAYVQSLNSIPSPYDQYLAGNSTDFSVEAQAGLALFEGKAGCSSCHNGPTFSDNNFYTMGVPENGEVWSNPIRHITFRRFFRLFGVQNFRTIRSDPGYYALTQTDKDWGAFRTAPLRELTHTAPYMHNGIFATLKEVVEFYNDGAGNGTTLGLTDTEIAQLVTFLESLSSELTVVEAPSLPQYQLRPLGENR